LDAIVIFGNRHCSKQLGGVVSIIKGTTLYWFFVALILCKKYYAVIDYLANTLHIKALFLHIASVLFLLFIPYHFFKFQFNYFFYLIGGVLMKRGLPSISKFLVFIGAVFTLVIGYFYPTKWTFYNVGMCVMDNSVPYMPLFIFGRWFVYLVATTTAFELFRSLYKRTIASHITSFLVQLGNKTLLIYGFHMFLVADIYGYLVKKYTNGSGLFPDNPFIRYYVIATFLTIVTILICLLLDKAKSRNNFFRIFFLGE